VTRTGRSDSRGWDVAVIGGGIMGASAALNLAREGLKVVVLERGVPGLEASAANAGTLSLQNKPLASIPAILEALAMWASLGEELGVDVGYRRKGGIRICGETEDLEKLRSDHEAQRRAGAPSVFVDRAELAGDFPYLGPWVVAGTWCELDGMADPFVSTEAFLRAARLAGAELRSRTPVTGMTGGEGRPFAIRTPHGVVEADRVVAAAGAWNREVAGWVGVDLPIRTLVQQVLITTPLPRRVPHVVTHVGGRLTMKQQVDTGRVLVGGGWPGDGSLEEDESRVRRESLFGNLELACAVVPALKTTSLLRAWTGFEGRTSDRLLLAGPAGPEGFFILGCQSGGFTMSPLAGEIITDHILARTSRIPVDAFLPGRTATWAHAGTAVLP